MTLIFKILDAGDWRAAVEAGIFHGAGIDRADGYIHFSTAETVAETASRHFAGRDGLVLVAVEAEGLGAALKWEVSRGGALFPHLYAPLAPGAAVWVAPLPLDADGRHVFPEGLAASKDRA